MHILASPFNVKSVDALNNLHNEIVQKHSEDELKAAYYNLHLSEVYKRYKNKALQT